MTKQILQTSIVLLLSTVCAKSQSPTDNSGLFKNTRSGLTFSYFYNFQGQYVYILQPNAHVVEQTEDKQGAVISAVILFGLDNSGNFNFLLNLPIADIKNGATSFFNSQTPFGVGFAYFPTKVLGISAISNFGLQYRMRKDPLANQYFPTNIYPTLQVYAPVPDYLTKPYSYQETTISINIGIIVKL